MSNTIMFSTQTPPPYKNKDGVRYHILFLLSICTGIGAECVTEGVGMSPKYQIVPNSEEHIIRFIKVNRTLHSDQNNS